MIDKKTVVTIARMETRRNLFRAITSLWDIVMLLRDVNSKHKVFSCAKATTSGRVLSGTVKEIKWIYPNNEEHTHLDVF